MNPALMVTVWLTPRNIIKDDAGWVAVAPTTGVYSGGVLRVTGGLSGGVYYNFASVIGKTYRLVFTVAVVSAGDWYMIAKSAANGGGSNLKVETGTTGRTVVSEFVATTAQSSLYVQATNGASFDFSGMALR